MYPSQGHWSDLDYLEVTEGTNRLVELSNGRLEVLAMPTSSHQRIMLFLLTQLQAFVIPKKLGEALCAPLRLRIQEGKFREPDIIFALEQNRSRIGEDFWEGADLVMEVVSNDPESRKRDLEQKPIDYALCGIPEYWIVDPQEKKITVLVLQGEHYQTAGVYSEGTAAASQLLPEFVVGVTEVFAAAKV
ncbi:MAG: Uma2 family endonuclease [Pirellulales bacterium]|nr:Uma2 family endonuclease [Pirellulales bacterium]